MGKAKQLIYHGMPPVKDVMPKVKYEDIPEDRRKKWQSHLATFDGVVGNDQEFEEWLAVYVHVVWMDGDYKRYIKDVPKKIPGKQAVRNIRGLVDKEDGAYKIVQNTRQVGVNSYGTQ